jgi:hypothetical protein
MSDSYDIETGRMFGPWEKLNVYFTMRMMAGWAVLGMSPSQWMQAVLDPSYCMIVDGWGDTGGGFEEVKIEVRKYVKGYYKDGTPRTKRVCKFYLWSHENHPNANAAYLDYLDSMLTNTWYSEKGSLTPRRRMTLLKRLFKKYNSQSDEVFSISRWRLSENKITGNASEMLHKVFLVDLKKVDISPLVDPQRVTMRFNARGCNLELDASLWTALVFLFFMYYEYCNDMHC